MSHVCRRNSLPSLSTTSSSRTLSAPARITRPSTYICLLAHWWSTTLHYLSSSLIAALSRRKPSHFRPSSRLCFHGRNDDDSTTTSTRNSLKTPRGYLPIRIRETSQRYFVRATLVNHPLLADLLHKSAQEYGFSHHYHGALRVTCDAPTLESILHAIIP